jgi:iron complex transport system permease protein
MRSDVARRGRPGSPAVLVTLAALLVVQLVVAVSLGTVTVPVGTVWRHLAAHVTAPWAGDTPAHLDPLTDQIVWTLRAPRVLLAAVVGAGLAAAGVALQGLVRNPLADPYVLGVSSGASLGAVVVLAFGSAAVAGLGVSGAAFAGAAASLAAVFVLSGRTARMNDSRLVLAGVAVGYLAMAATSFVQLRAPAGQVRGILFWLMGSVAGATWADLGVPTLVIAGCVGWLLRQGRALNALAVGDDDAAALGVEVPRLRVGLLLVSALLTATSVAVAGGVGFVGLMLPHTARLVVGADHRRLLPTAALAGAVFLVAVDLAARTVDRPNEYPITVFTAALGAPFFLWLLHRDGRATG